MKMFPQLIKIFFTGIIALLPFYISSQNSSEAICGTVTTSETLDYFNELKPQLKNYEATFMSSKKTQNLFLKTTFQLKPILSDPQTEMVVWILQNLKMPLLI